MVDLRSRITQVKQGTGIIHSKQVYDEPRPKKPKRLALAVEEEDEDDPPFPTPEEDVESDDIGSDEIGRPSILTARTPQGLTRITVGVSIKRSINYNSFEASHSAEITTEGIEPSVEEATAQLKEWVILQCGDSLSHVLDQFAKE